MRLVVKKFRRLSGSLGDSWSRRRGIRRASMLMTGMSKYPSWRTGIVIVCPFGRSRAAVFTRTLY